MKELFENYLAHCLDYLPQGRIKEAMLYSLNNKAKRIRPLLLLNMVNDLGENLADALAIAAAIEMIHTYSLIHDDLPAMDNDDYRRGQLTNHKKFDEATAILAGDGLLSEAFTLIAKSNYSDEIKIKLLDKFVEAAGLRGMIKGQELDIYQDDNTDLMVTDLLKTGCLIALPLQCGAIISGNEGFLDKFMEYGKIFGLCFQIQDDILDVMGDEKELGKSINSDAKNSKKTYVSVYGLEKSRDILNEYYTKMNLILDEIGLALPSVESLVLTCRNRKY